MFQQDYLLRQIQNLIRFIARLLFHQEPEEIALPSEDSEAGRLRLDLQALLAKGDINGAENLLFERLDTDSLPYMAVALSFYDQLNAMKEEDLEGANYSRAEIESGLRDIAARFGLLLEGK